MSNPWLIPGIKARLRELHPDRTLSFRDIASQLNKEFSTTLTANACIGRAHRLGLPDRPSPISPGRKPIICDPIPIEQLNSTNCHYAVSKLEDRPPYLYCGMPARQGFAWCAEHYRKVYTAPRAR